MGWELKGLGTAGLQRTRHECKRPGKLGLGPSLGEESKKGKLTFIEFLLYAKQTVCHTDYIILHSNTGKPVFSPCAKGAGGQKG